MPNLVSSLLGPLWASPDLSLPCPHSSEHLLLGYTLLVALELMMAEGSLCGGGWVQVDRVLTLGRVGRGYSRSSL